VLLAAGLLGLDRMLNGGPSSRRARTLDGFPCSKEDPPLSPESDIGSGLWGHNLHRVWPCTDRDCEQALSKPNPNDQPGLRTTWRYFNNYPPISRARPASA
jgi:hypothetical protein